MKCWEVIAIGGGATWHRAGDDVMQRAYTGALWRPGPDVVVELENDPIDLIVEGYPESRTLKEPNGEVVITMKRRSSKTPIFILRTQLTLLAERPYIVKREL